VSRASSPLGPLLALGGFACYSLHDVFVKVMGDTISVVQIVFFAALLTFPLLSVMLIRDPVPARLVARNPGWVALRTFGVVASAALGFYAFTVIPFAQAYAMLFVTPLLITLLSVPVLGEKVGLRRGLAVAIGLSGVLIVLRPGLEAVTLGHLAGLASALCSSLVGISSRKIGHEERMGVLILWPLLATVGVMGAALPWVYVPMTLTDLGLITGVAILGFAAMLLMIQAYRRAEAALVAPMQYSQMLWAVFYGVLVFDEWPDLWTLAGAGVIIASGLYIVLREARLGPASLSPTQGSVRPGPGVAAGPPSPQGNRI